MRLQIGRLLKMIQIVSGRWFRIKICDVDSEIIKRIRYRVGIFCVNGLPKVLIRVRIFISDRHSVVIVDVI